MALLSSKKLTTGTSRIDRPHPSVNFLFFKTKNHLMALLKNIQSTPDQLVQDLTSEGNLKKLLKDSILSSLYNKSLNDKHQLEKINNFYNKSFNIDGDTLLI